MVEVYDHSQDRVAVYNHGHRVCSQDRVAVEVYDHSQDREVGQDRDRSGSRVDPLKKVHLEIISGTLINRLVALPMIDSGEGEGQDGLIPGRIGKRDQSTRISLVLGTS